jgi:hypothetical protein
MIEFTKSYKTQDGQVFGSIGEAQIHELEILFNAENGYTDSLLPNKIAHHILSNKDFLIDVLTTTPNSKPKARTTHGGTKNRKRAVITDAVTDASRDTGPGESAPAEE